MSPLSTDEERALRAYLTAARQTALARIAAGLPSANARPVALHRAMHHLLGAGGKFFRAGVALLPAHTAGHNGTYPAVCAAAVELMHTGTLIHDDLPAFDAAATRRGVPAVHVAYGDAIALLAGDTLMTAPFALLAEAGDAPDSVRLACIRALGRAVRSDTGVMGGQALELDPTAALADVHAAKTAALIRAAAEMGAWAAASRAELVQAWSAWGWHIGLAFQLADDLLDTSGDAAAMGKPVHQDERGNKPNAVRQYGAPEARRQAAAHLEAAKAALAAAGPLPAEAMLLARAAVFRAT